MSAHTLAASRSLYSPVGFPVQAVSLLQTIERILLESSLHPVQDIKHMMFLWSAEASDHVMQDASVRTSKGGIAAPD